MPTPIFRARLTAWAKALKTEIAVLTIAARDPRTPWHAKAVAVATVAYALSPIDLIPDVVPVLGLIDDLILVPAGLWLTLRLIPAEVMTDARTRAHETPLDRSRGRAAAAVIVLLWVVSALAAALWLFSFLPA